MNFLKKIKNLTIMGAADISAKGISALFWFYMATVLTTESYGEINYFIAIAGIASTFSLVGSGVTMTVYTAKNVKIQSTLSFVAIILGTVGGIIVYFIFENIGLSLFILGYVISRMAASHLLGKKMYSTWAKYLITQNLLMVTLSIGLFNLYGPDGVILGVGLSWFAYSPRIFKSFRESKIDFPLLKSKLGFMLNNYALDITTTFTGSIDKLIIAPMLGFALLGNYALGLQFMAMLTILPANVYRYVLPQDASGVSTTKIKKGIIFISIIISLVGIFIAPEIISRLFPKYEQAVFIIQIFSFSIVPTTISSMLISKFLGDEKSLLVLIGSGVYISSQVISILILGKIYGIDGVAASFVIASIVQVSYLFFINRIYRKK
jgi:O-antigen/teichoic acid export membrane protein